MAEVAFTIAGRSYNLACDDGEEIRLTEVAALVDEEATKLMQGAGQISEARLMLMTSLMLADRMDDAIRELAARPAPNAESDTETVVAIETASDRIAALSDEPDDSDETVTTPAMPTPPPATEVIEPAGFETDWNDDALPPETSSKATAEVQDLHEIIARRRARLNRALEAGKQAQEKPDEPV